MVPAGSRQPLPNSAAYEVVKVQDSSLLAMVSGESSPPYHCVLKVNLYLMEASRLHHCVLKVNFRAPSLCVKGGPV